MFCNFLSISILLKSTLVGLPDLIIPPKGYSLIGSKSAKETFAAEMLQGHSEFRWIAKTVSWL